jgi:hypothetical protein
MYMRIFNEFVSGNDTLRVYQNDKLLFSSKKDRVIPLLEYIDRFADQHREVVIFDKIMGNAAALLSVKANASEVYSPLGSQLAVITLDRYDIKHHLNQITDFIRKPASEEMCPMERLSIDKEPEEFFTLMKRIIK